MNYKESNNRILMLANIPHEGGRYRGGITYIAEEIMKSKDILTRNGYDITSFNTEVTNRKCDTENKWDFDNIKNALLLTNLVKKEIKKNKYDKLYMHGSVGLGLFKTCYLIRRLRKIFRGDIILHIHYAELTKILPQNQLLRKMIINTIDCKVDKLIMLSESTKNEFINIGIQEEKISVIYNFHTMDYCNDEISRKIEGIIEREQVNILFVGSIDTRKGIIDLLKSVKKINTNDYSLHICGKINDYTIKNEFESLVESLNKNVTFHGYLNGEYKKEIFKNADILVLPSYGEGLPIVILEAMSSGCAIISTSVGAIPEIINNGIEGIIIEPGNIIKLEESLQLLLEDRNSLRKMMFKSYQASFKYEINQFLEKLIEVCDG